MKITIHSGSKVKDLKTLFHDTFSELKIELFKPGHQVSGGQAKAGILDNEQIISLLPDFQPNSPFEFDENTKISEFENGFTSHFNVAVQVFRKSGNLYLETTETDHWTLAESQEEALQSNVAISDTRTNLRDRDQSE
jgi:hypothetical protein